MHLAAEALTAGTGIARVENVGPIMLGQLHAMLGNRCSISLKPVITRRTHPPRLLRNPRAAARTTPAALPRRCVSLRRHSEPQHRHRPHHPVSKPGPRRAAARPNSDWQPRTPRTAPSQRENPRPLASPTTRTRHLAVAITEPTHLPRQRHRHPPRPATPTTPRQSGMPPSRYPPSSAERDC